MHKRRFKNVAVIMGGVSSERSISISSGEAVFQGLMDADYLVRSVVLDKEELPDLDGVEAVFIALHGRFGEDGAIQKLLDEKQIPYTGAGSRESLVAFDKLLTREALKKTACPLPEALILNSNQQVADITLPLPLVVKPPCEGSSVGITIVREEKDLASAIGEGRRHSEVLLLESYIAGREWTVGIVDGKVLPPIEIMASLDGGWYSWNAKYHSAGTTRYLFPEDNPEDGQICREVSTLALKVYETLQIRGMARVDFRVSPDGKPYVLELNTIPGFTASSLLPKAAARAGISFPELCTMIMESAVYG